MVRREMVTGEIAKMEEERRNAQAVGQAQQGRWTCWEDIEQRKLKWSDIWAMEPTRLRFALGATYDQLPTPANLVRWNQTSDAKCSECNQRETLRHLLSNCHMSLGRYTWRHNQVLREIEKCASDRCEYANEGGENTAKCKRKQCLYNSGEWQLSCDLNEQMTFPPHIALTTQRPDMVIWSDKLKTVILMELTVPWEENFSHAHERKLDRYEQLSAQCKDNGWQCEVFAVEVGCRGFIGKSVMKFLQRIGIDGQRLRRTTKSIANIAEISSAWIWNQHCLRSKAN